MSLAIVIPAAWLAIAAFVVIVCQMARQGDAFVAAATSPGRVLMPGLTVYDEAAATLLCPPRRQPAHRSGRMHHRASSSARTLRAGRSSCATRS